MFSEEDWFYVLACYDDLYQLPLWFSSSIIFKKEYVMPYYCSDCKSSVSISKVKLF